jgi:hypothetical protein
MFSVKYKLGFYFPENEILRIHIRENLVIHKFFKMIKQFDVVHELKLLTVSLIK